MCPVNNFVKARRKTSYFADFKLIRTVGGKGGDGCVSFLQLWSNEKAGADGGDGGNGGHIILRASKDVHSLNHLSYNICGDKGNNGSHNNCHGRNAKHTVIKVPVGTIIRTQQGTIVGDLDKENLMFVAARGGAGGRGNTFFTNNTNKTPKLCENGSHGENVFYYLELSSMADIAIIGYPNAGKSTLLNSITRARPKVAPYAFTTIHPHIGIVQYSDHTQLAVADLPGITVGSHYNRGLGIQFLKHVERCKILIFLLDASCEHPWLDYENLLNEITKFNSSLRNYTRIVVANKIDDPLGNKNLPILENYLKEKIIGISAKHGHNLEYLLKIMRETFIKTKLKDDHKL